MTRVTSDGTLGMKESLRVSVGAVVLALATLAAVIFAWLNFLQRSSYDLVDDGVAWTDSANGIEAWKVMPNSPAAAAGIHPGDHLLAIDDVPVPNEKHVAQRLFRAGLWTQLRYKLSRNGEEFETRLITAPAQKPLHRRKLRARSRPAVSVHRAVHFHSQMECAARRSLLRVLPGFLHPVFLPLQRQAGHLRSGSVLVRAS